MKKIYLSILAVGFAFSAFAQNFIVADYESAAIDDVVPSLNQWGSADKISASVIAVFDETTGALNTSTKVAKVLPVDWNSYLYVDVTLPEGKNASDYNCLNFKFYSADITWKSVDVLAKVGDGEIFSISNTTVTNHIKSATSKWVNVIVPLNPAQVGTITETSFRLIFGLNVNSGTYYVDNVELSHIMPIANETTSDILMADYDLYSNGSIMPIWSRWGQTDAIFAEVDDVPGPSTGTGNSSTKSCKVTLHNYDQYLGFDVVIPEGKTITNYESVTFKAYVDMTTPVGGTAADGQWKSWSIYAKEGSADFFSISTDNPSTGSNDQVWTDVVIPIDQTKAAALTGNSFILIVGISAPKVYYWVDDIVLKAVATNGIKNTSRKLSVVSQSGEISIKGATGLNIKIYNLSGSAILNKTALSSNETIALPKGIYLVNAGGKTSKVVVK